MRSKGIPPYFETEDRMYLGSDGNVYPRSVVENLDKLFSECVLGNISPPMKITILDDNPPMTEDQMASLFAKFGKENVEVIPPPPGPPIKAKLIDDSKETSPKLKLVWPQGNDFVVKLPRLCEDEVIDCGRVWSTLEETTDQNESVMESFDPFDGDTSNEASSLCGMSGNWWIALRNLVRK